MVPPPTSNHTRVQLDVVFAFREIGGRRGLIPCHEPMGLFNTSNNYRVPDAMLVKAEQISERGAEGAELVLEVLSPGDESRDKFGFYAKLGVREIWLIQPKTRELEVWELVDGAYLERAPTASPLLGIRIVTTAEPKLELIDGDLTYAI